MQIERIYVVYTAITPESAPFYHKDLYYERFDGSVVYMRGYPGQNGQLSTSVQIFQPNSAALARVRSWELGREVLTSGTDLSSVAQLMLAELQRIENADINYVRDDTNSNWAVDKAILKAGLSLPSEDNFGEFWSPGSIHPDQANRISDDYTGGDSHLNVGNSATDDECFSAGTMITLADGGERAIEDIRVGDAVLSFDGDGHLVAGRVSRLLENVTDTWLSVSAKDGRALGVDKGAGEGRMVVTPGHRFLRPDGSFEEIAATKGMKERGEPSHPWYTYSLQDYAST